MPNPKPKQVVVKSALIQAYSYDSDAQTLSVTFRDGSEFDYQKVDPPTMSKVFDSGGSVGGKFHRLIMRGNYKFNRTS